MIVMGKNSLWWLPPPIFCKGETMDERVLWGLSAVLLMALLMEADPERLWALTQVLLLGALEGLLKGVLLGF